MGGTVFSLIRRHYLVRTVFADLGKSFTNERVDEITVAREDASGMKLANQQGGTPGQASNEDAEQQAKRRMSRKTKELESSPET
ncbi:MAG: hypothetical protein M1836_008012 [Candelina mexicana]|nr:MAG: hypothetical protein M1836_008012 [Candelina mexicana]